MTRWSVRYPLLTSATATAAALTVFFVATAYLQVALAHRKALDAPLAEGPDDFGAVGPFAFTERSGHAVTQDTLRGKVWIAACFLTCCTESCPQLSGSLA